MMAFFYSILASREEFVSVINCMQETHGGEKTFVMKCIIHRQWFHELPLPQS